MMILLEEKINSAWENRELLKDMVVQAAIRDVIEQLDKGFLRVAQPMADGSWQVNEWVKKAVVMYFPIQQMETIEVGPFEFHDKIPLKRNYKELGVRVQGLEGEKTGEWVLVDLGDIIVHVMQPEIRRYYNLEQLWGGRPPSPHATTWRNAPGAEPPATL